MAKTAEVKRLECPRCGCHHFEFVDERKCIGGVMRRYSCRHCERRLSARTNDLDQQQQAPEDSAGAD